MAKQRINTQSDVEALKKLIKEFKGLASQLKTTTQTLTQLQGSLTAVTGVTKESGQAIAELQKQLKNTTATKKRFVTQTRNLKKANQELTQSNKKLQQQLNKTNKTAKQGGSLFKTLFGSAKRLIGAFGVIAGISVFTKILKEGYEVLKEFDAIAFAMEKISRSTEELLDSQKFLTTITQNFGISIVSTTQRYLKFLASANQVGLSLKQTQKIFESVSKASAVLGLRTDELTGVYLALEQMLSKGKVTTEELRRQLGERLPGAMGIMAEAMNVSISELDKMMKKGEVLSSEALPKFAVALEEAYGLASVSKIETLQSAQIRLTNTFGLIVDKIRTSTTVTQGLIGVYNVLTDAMQSIFNLTKEVETASATRIRQIRQESIAYNSLAQEILATNDDEEKRLDLIKKMVEEYPFMLQYLDDEKLSNERLRDALQEVNNLYIKRIALSKLQQKLKLEETTQRVASATAAEAIAMTNLRNAISTIIQKSQGQITADVYDEDDILKSAENTMKKLEALELKFTKEGFDKGVRIVQQQMKVLRRTEKEYRGAQSILGLDETDLKNIKSELKNFEKELGLTAKQIEEFFNKEDAFTLRFKLGDDKKGGKEKIDTSDLDLELEILRGIQEDYLRKVEDEQNLSEEVRLKMLENYFDTREDILKTQREKELRLAGDDTNKKLQAEEKYINEKKALQTEEAIDRLNLIEQFGDEEIKMLEEKYNDLRNLDVIALRKRYGDISKLSKEEVEKYQKELEEIDRTHHNNKLQAMAEYLEKLIEDLGLEGEIKKEFQQKINEFLANMRDEDIKKEQLTFEKKLEYLYEFTQSALDVADSFVQRRIENVNAEIEAERKKYDAMIEMAKDDVSKREMLEQERDAKLALLEKKRLKEEQKAARIRKAQALVDIAMNTAVGISNAAKKGFLGIPEKIWVAAIGVAQAAAVMAQPIPQYKDGVKDLHEDQVAMINDGGQKEYVERNGKILSTDTKNAIVQLRKGDTVHKNYDSMVKDSILYNLIAQGQPLSQSKFDSLGEVIKNGIDQGFRRAKIQNNIVFNHRSRNKYLDNKSRFN